MVLAAESGFNWMILGIGTIFLVKNRSWNHILYITIIIIATYILGQNLEQWWPYLLIGGLVLAYLLKVIGDNGPADAGGMGALGDLLGGEAGI